MQKLVFCVLFVLPLLLEGQQAISITDWPEIKYDQSCTPDDQRVIRLLEGQTRPWAPHEFGPSPVKSTNLSCRDGWGGDGAVGGSMLIIGMRDLPYVFHHEMGHIFAPGWFHWTYFEALPEAGAVHLAKLTQSWDSGSAVATEIRMAGTLDQCLNWHKGGKPLYYRQAMLPLLKVATANQVSKAQDWAYSNLVAKAYAALRQKPTLQVLEAPDRIETARLVGSAFSKPVDSMPAWMFLRQQSHHGLVSLGSFAESYTAGTLGSTAINPVYLYVVNWDYTDTPYDFRDIRWWRQWSGITRREVLGQSMEVVIRNWQEREVYRATVKSGEPYLLPQLPIGAYTVETLRPNGELMHRNQYVVWSGEPGLSVFKTGWDGLVREQPTSVGNARVIYDGNGFAVVEPFCKDVRPCEIMVQSDTLERFTVLTPWWQDQVVRLHNRRPVFNLPESITIAPGGSATLEIRNLVAGIPDYSWSFTALTPAPGIEMDRWSGQGNGVATVRVIKPGATGQSSILRFDVPGSADTPQYIEVRGLPPPPAPSTPPRARGTTPSGEIPSSVVIKKP